MRRHQVVTQETKKENKKERKKENKKERKTWGAIAHQEVGGAEEAKAHNAEA